MLPRWHIFFGAIFAAVIWILAPATNWFYILLVFASSVLIDFDHYWDALMRTGHFSLNEAFEYHKRLAKKEEENAKKGIRTKLTFHLFHTIEFHILIGLLGLIWIGFFYIFLGMVFHSLLDLISLTYADRLYLREFFFFNWMRNKF